MALLVWVLWPTDPTTPAADGVATAAVGAGKSSPGASPKAKKAKATQLLRPAADPSADTSGLVLPPGELPPIAAPAQPVALAPLRQASEQVRAIPEDSVLETQGWISTTDSRIAQQMVWQRVAPCLRSGQSLGVQFGVAGGRGASDLYQPQWQGDGGPVLASCLTGALRGLRLPVATDTQGLLTLQFGPPASAKLDWQRLQ